MLRFVTLLALAAAPLPAQIVAANSYDVEIRTSPLTDVNGYHSDTCAELEIDLARGPKSKPILISDDGAHLANCSTLRSCPRSTAGLGLDASCANLYASTAKARGGHYEHHALTADRRLEGCDTRKLTWWTLSTDERRALRQLHRHATLLSPRGTLSVGRNAAGRGELRWNGAPVTLIGWSAYGALVSAQVDPVAFLDTLTMHKPAPDGSTKGVNATRIWLLDQWAALKAGCSTSPTIGAGMTPWVESGATLPGRYDLEQFDDAYFARLRAFVSAAWDRGIVVIVTLYDRNGLFRSTPRSYGRWDGSPYNAANNRHPALSASLDSRYPINFLSYGCTGSARVRDWHRDLIDRTVRELRPYGNVIFETMNEPEPRVNPEPAWSARINPFLLAVAHSVDRAWRPWISDPFLCGSVVVERPGVR